MGVDSYYILLLKIAKLIVVQRWGMGVESFYILLLKIAKLIVVNRVFESLEKLVGLVSRVSIAGHY
jgi:hypothetical protein